MDNIQIQVLRFFLLLNALPVEKKSKIMADPLCCNAIVDTVRDGMVDVSNGVVYNLYMYHSHLFTATMVSQEISAAMSTAFNGDEWAKYHRQSLLQIAAARRAELLGGRPTLKLN